MRLELQPIMQVEAFEFIKRHHSHHVPPQGWICGIAINNGERVCGVIVIGRPVARFNQDGWTAEVTRCCSDGSQKNIASKLYGAAWRAVRALGYKRLITYTLVEEKGTSLKAAGWKIVGQTKGGTWNRKNRPRIDKHPTGQKTIWEVKSEV